MRRKIYLITHIKRTRFQETEANMKLDKTLLENRYDDMLLL